MALSTPPTIESVEAFPIRLPRDLKLSTGTAGTPTTLGRAAGGYRWSAAYPVLYSEYLETALVKVKLDNGLHGWGEAQAPVAPRVACTIVTDLLAPVLRGEAFDGEQATIEALWRRMFQTMRVRGQTGGFMLDAISGVDLALWDLAGKLLDRPVARLLAGSGAKTSVPCYLSGLSGRDEAERLEFARRHCSQGFRLLKIFHDSKNEDLLSRVGALQAALGEAARLAVDALWRLDIERDRPLLRELEARRLVWLECPFNPDELDPHRQLRREYDIPLAAGESYRTRQELEPFFAERLIRFVQPDLGRCGITGALKIGLRAAECGVELVPHVSIALGPQIAAAIHTAAGISGCSLCEYNPHVFLASNRYLVEPLSVRGACYLVPETAGLGVELRQAELLEAALSFP